MYFSSVLVAKQTSKHDKYWVAILIDEGSILGGVSFIACFLG